MGVGCRGWGVGEKLMGGRGDGEMGRDGERTRDKRQGTRIKEAGNRNEGKKNCNRLQVTGSKLRN